MSELNTGITDGMTTEEMLELERQRNAALEAELAPFRALRKQLDIGLRAAVVAGQVSDTELEGMVDAIREWKPGLSVVPGDTLRREGVVYVVVQAHTTQADWIPGQGTLAIYRRANPETAPGETAPWQPDTQYNAGDFVLDGDVEYECIQGHTSQAGWEPHNTAALWKVKGA